MKLINLNKILGVSALLGSVTIASGQDILQISQPTNNGGTPINWAWQSITVLDPSILTTFAFRWNGASGDLGATATVELLTGQGTSGTVLASTTGSVSYDASVSHNFFVADFGNIVLSPGQYTVYVFNSTDELQFEGTSYDSYSGGEFVSDTYGNAGGDAAFSTPLPTTVPEPNSLALAGLGLVSVGGFTVLKRQTAKREPSRK